MKRAKARTLNDTGKVALIGSDLFGSRKIVNRFNLIGRQGIRPLLCAIYRVLRAEARTLNTINEL